MFTSKPGKSTFGSAIRTLELIYHDAVRNVRTKNSNAAVAILASMSQVLMLVAMFYVMFSILGMRKFAIRGDFLLYIFSGIFLYVTHIKAVSAVSGAGAPNNPILKHAPMNTAISMAGSVLSMLYIQVMSLVIVLFVYSLLGNPLDMPDPVSAFAMFLLAFFTGLGVGMIFLALKPWFPGFVGLAQPIYQRANMIASGKMFLANSLPGYMLVMFDWNPLFHCIDQARGFAFNNYFPRNSNWEYALWVGIVLLMIGLMGEFYTRQRVSASWGARR